MNRAVKLIFLAMAVEVSGVVAQAANYTNNASGAWSAAGSWSGSKGASALDAVIVFNPSGTDNSTNDNVGAFLLNKMWVMPGQTVNLYASGESSLLFTNNGTTMPVITNLNAGMFTLNTPITMGTNLIIGVGNSSGNITISSNITSIAGGATNTLTKTGAGTLTLTATNTFLGMTTVSDGTLTVNGGQLTNTAAVTVQTSGGAASASLVLTNGGKVFSTGTSTVYPGITNMVLVTGANSLWNLGQAYLYVRGVFKVDNAGVVTNEYRSYMDVSGGKMIITNGGKYYGGFANQWIGYSGTIGNSVYVGANGATWTGGKLFIGYNGARGNFLTVDNGGVVSVPWATIGNDNGSSAFGNAIGNYMVITNGGQFFSTGNIGIGNGVGCNSNYVNVVVGGARWDLGNQTLAIGTTGATGNWMTVSSGGVLTNGNVTLGGVGSEFTIGAGGTAWVGNVSVSNGTVLVNGSLSATGTVSVLANAVLGGAGAISGDVFILAGGILSPDMSGTMAIRSLALLSQSVLK
jgi:autotransporter-associated beta strand protein